MFVMCLRIIVLRNVEVLILIKNLYYYEENLKFIEIISIWDEFFTKKRDLSSDIASIRYLLLLSMLWI